MARHLVLIVAATALAACTPGSASEGSDPATDGDGSTSSGETESVGEETDLSTDVDSTGTSEGEESTGTGAVCGDGSVDGDEACDDGNTDSFDGCSAACAVEYPVEQLAVGVSHACIVSMLGVKCWGPGGFGTLGLGDTEKRGDEPDEMGANLPFVDVGFDVQSLVAGNAVTCAMAPSGMLKCWGCNTYGQLGLGDGDARGDEPGEMGDALPVVDLDFLVDFVAHGNLNGCALGETGLKCWGFNGYGQLGLGDILDRGDEPREMGAALPVVDLGMEPVEVVLGGLHACARDGLGRVKCWGANGYSGSLGLGDEEHRGDEPGEMGDALPFVDLGLGAEVVALAERWDGSCAVLATGGMRCWGRTFGLWPGAEDATGDEPGEMGDALPELVSGDDRVIVEAAAGGGFVCARFDDGSVRCVGTNEFGQLGQGHSDPVSDWFEDIPDTDLGEPALDIGAGRHHMCALMQSGNVKCWGCAGEGDEPVCASSLGYGDEENRGDEPGEMGDALPYVSLF